MLLFRPENVRITCMGLISARVKATGQLFLAGMDMGTDGSPQWRDPVSPLQDETWYSGNLLDGEVGQTHYIEYSEVSYAKFKGKELEETSSLRLLPIRVKKEIERSARSGERFSQ